MGGFLGAHNELLLGWVALTQLFALRLFYKLSDNLCTFLYVLLSSSKKEKKKKMIWMVNIHHQSNFKGDDYYKHFKLCRPNFKFSIPLISKFIHMGWIMNHLWFRNESSSSFVVGDISSFIYSIIGVLEKGAFSIMRLFKTQNFKSYRVLISFNI